MSKDKIIKKESAKITKSGMVKELKKLGLNFDISSLPDDVVISGYEIDLTDPKDPIFRGTYLSKQVLKLER
ncbi:hypothetical protein A2210_00835 [Candidatus Woesebacteria bacterium RIFOXYA1_FULL_40_18]|uniref:Uncharacterized protein n=1 Tax=Candidatus Woesebacteria bacterium RIFOXYA1_FULL_40_18 TaxID=1802532 RepID=A0A1F8CKS2_9BACT|nr:MAG: hypothetical protein A2210_00835 [Candidatus Woesebacteria bacterium RIFOXYA1_FULL_40_18]